MAKAPVFSRKAKAGALLCFLGLIIAERFVYKKVYNNEPYDLDTSESSFAETYYSVKNGVETKLSSAPSAIGRYKLVVSPSDEWVEAFNENFGVELNTSAIENQEIEFSITSGNEWTVEFNANGGKFEDDFEETKIDTVGNIVDSLPTATPTHRRRAMTRVL